MTLWEQIWKYTMLGVTSIVFEETNPILGGIAAENGVLEMFWVIVSVALGTWAASLALYYVGAWRIDWVRNRWPSKARLFDRALEVVDRNPWRASLAVRFAYGLRLPVPIACGAARVPIVLYTIGSGISCWVWSIAFTIVGYAFGDAAHRVLKFTGRTEFKVGVPLLIALVILGIVLWRRRAAQLHDRAADS